MQRASLRANGIDNAQRGNWQPRSNPQPQRGSPSMTREHLIPPFKQPSITRQKRNEIFKKKNALTDSCNDTKAQTLKGALSKTKRQNETSSVLY